VFSLMIFSISGRSHMAYPFQPVTLNPGQVITAAQVNHLPIIAHYARHLGLVELVNRMVPVEMDVEPGQIVLGLVLLNSRLIWRLIEHAMHTDLAARHTTLLGWDNKPTRPPEHLHDDLEVQEGNRSLRGPTTSLGKTPLARSEGLHDGFADPRALFCSSLSCWLKRVSKNSKFSCQLGAECTLEELYICDFLLDTWKDLICRQRLCSDYSGPQSTRMRGYQRMHTIV
jgi:hypothetical protein